jgi:hypothetical protein
VRGTDAPEVDSPGQSQDAPGLGTDSLPGDSPPVFRFEPEPADPAAAQARRLLEVDQELTAAHGPILDRAALQEARRVAAERDIPVPDGQAVNDSGQPVATTRGARELLDDAEAQLAEADQVLACMIGGAA